MIRVNKGEVEVQGFKPLILAEISTLAYSLVNEGVLTEAEIRDAIEMGFKGEERIEEEEAKAKAKAEELMKDIMKKILEGLGN